MHYLASYVTMILFSWNLTLLPTFWSGVKLVLSLTGFPLVYLDAAAASNLWSLSWHCCSIPGHRLSMRSQWCFFLGRHQHDLQLQSVFLCSPRCKAASPDLVCNAKKYSCFTSVYSSRRGFPPLAQGSKGSEASGESSGSNKAQECWYWS